MFLFTPSSLWFRIFISVISDSVVNRCCNQMWCWIEKSILCRVALHIDFSVFISNWNDSFVHFSPCLCSSSSCRSVRLKHTSFCQNCIRQTLSGCQQRASQDDADIQILQAESPEPCPQDFPHFLCLLPHVCSKVILGKGRNKHPYTHIHLFVGKSLEKNVPGCRTFKNFYSTISFSLIWFWGVWFWDLLPDQDICLTVNLVKGFLKEEETFYKQVIIQAASLLCVFYTVVSRSLFIPTLLKSVYTD